MFLQSYNLFGKKCCLYIYTHISHMSYLGLSTCFVRIEHKVQLRKHAFSSFLRRVYNYIHVHMKQLAINLFHYQPNSPNMRNSFKAFFFLSSLILLHLGMCCLVSFPHVGKSFPRERNQSRKLLASPTSSLSWDPNKLRGNMEEAEESLEASLRKRPPSSSNPTQNK